MIRMFQILAVALAGAAAFFICRGDYDTAFVTGVLGICSFFLGLRFRFKGQLIEREAAVADEEENDDDNEASPSQ